jgi:hypothetical protein
LEVAVMSEMTQEEALRQADALVGQALREAEARCGVLGQYINDCDSTGSKTAAWSDALRELHALHGCRVVRVAGLGHWVAGLGA